MLDALFGIIFEMVLSAVGTVIATLFGVDDAAEVGGVIVGVGILVIGLAIALWGH